LAIPSGTIIHHIWVSNYTNARISLYRIRAVNPDSGKSRGEIFFGAAPQPFESAVFTQDMNGTTGGQQEPSLPEHDAEAAQIIGPLEWRSYG
jgi:hypothetical protein